MKPPINQHEALEEYPDQAGLPALDRIIGLERDRQHDTKVTMNMCGTLMPEGSAHTSVRPVFQRQPIGQERVVERRQAHHQAERRQDASKHDRVRHLEHEAQQAGQNSMLTRIFVPKPKNASNHPVSTRPGGVAQPSSSHPPVDQVLDAHACPRRAWPWSMHRPAHALRRREHVRRRSASRRQKPKPSRP